MTTTDSVRSVRSAPGFHCVPPDTVRDGGAESYLD